MPDFHLSRFPFDGRMPLKLSRNGIYPIVALPTPGVLFFNGAETD
jgi:hypothetical protein